MRVPRLLEFVRFLFLLTEFGLHGEEAVELVSDVAAVDRASLRTSVSAWVGRIRRFTT